MAEAPELGAADLATEVEIDMVIGKGSHGPGFLGIDMIVVIVAEDVALIKGVVHVKQVVVLHILIIREVAFRELIHIEPVGAAEHIVDGLVVFLLDTTNVNTAEQLDMLRQGCIEIGTAAEEEMVEDPVLHHILAALALHGRKLVHLIHLVPVDLGIGLVVGSPIVEDIVVIAAGIAIADLIGRQVAIVVRARVWHIVPVQGGGIVAPEGGGEGGLDMNLVALGGVGVGQHNDRLAGSTHAGVALLALVPAPVGVIIVVIEQVIHLLDGIGLHTPGGVGGKGGEVEVVVRIQLLLHSEETSKAVVGGSFHV